MAAIKSQLDDDIQNHRSRKSTASLSRKQQMRDSDKKIYSNYYFRLTNHGTGRTFVVMTDYQQLPDMGGESINGVLYRDPRDERVTVIRINTGARTPLGSRPVSLARDTASIYIDGVRYELEKRPRETEEELPLIESDENEHDYASEIDTLADAISNREKEILSSLFVSKTDKQQLTAYLQDFYKEIAFTRQDIAKL
jgi:MoxR-like ATPase